MPGDGSPAFYLEETIKKTRSALWMIVLFVLAAAPAPASAQQTSYDYDRAADFSRFRTFAWKEGTPAGEPSLDRRIVAAIEAQLAAKGLTRTNENPDLYVVYHLGADVQKSLNGSISGHGYGPYGWGWGSGFESINIRESAVLVGMLVIDMADAAKREIVWRGLAAGDVDIHAKPEKRDAKVDKAVAKILKNYPPKARK
jgi:hypothetical protein